MACVSAFSGIGPLTYASAVSSVRSVRTEGSDLVLTRTHGVQPQSGVTVSSVNCQAAAAAALRPALHSSFGADRLEWAAPRLRCTQASAAQLLESSRTTTALHWLDTTIALVMSGVT